MISPEYSDLVEMDADATLGRRLRCAIDQNLSVHRWSLAVGDGDRWTFGTAWGPTLEVAHARGCPRCVVAEEAGK